MPSEGIALHGIQLLAAFVDGADGKAYASYATLKDALADAVPGTVVRLEKDYTMTESVVVPGNVTLVLPCVDADTGYQTHDVVNVEGAIIGSERYNHNGTSTAGTTGEGPESHLYRKLTIPAGVTLTVEGALLVNSVSGRPSGGSYEMDITGGYAEIELSGSIEVADGGELENYGYVKGSGQITVNSGGTLADLYIIRNWRGGSQALKMYNNKIYPMNEADCHNIQCKLRVNYGATLLGLVKMFASDLSNTGRYHFTRFPQVGSSNSLTVLKPGAWLLRSYDAVNDREIYELHGDGSFASSELNIVGQQVSSEDYFFPIDGDTDYILCDGDFHFENRYKVMPVASVTVRDGATLTVDAKSRLVFYDAFDDSVFGSTAYPANRPGAVLKLEQEACFINDGLFAGKIETEGDNIFVGSTAAAKSTTPWAVKTKEGNGMSGVYVTKDLNFALDIERPGYTWRYADTALGEAPYSIIWMPGAEGEFVAAITAAKTQAGADVTLIMNNQTDGDVTRNYAIAAYDAEHKMVALKWLESYAVSAGVLDTQDLKLNSRTEIAEVKLFQIGDNLPLTREQRVWFS